MGTSILDILPLNREERFWTATVLPALVLGTDLEGFGRFVELLTRKTSASQPANADGFVVTEFSRHKSNGSRRVGPALRKTEREATPDILAVVTTPLPMVFGIEAKMFEPVSSIPWQLDLQLEHCLKPVAENLSASVGGDVEIHCVALVPAPRQLAMQAQHNDVVTWTDILDLGPGRGYYHKLLAHAIEEYEALTTPKARNYEGQLSGSKIELRIKVDDVPPKWIGAAKGKHGNYSTLKDDRWRDTVFTVNWSSPERPSSSWYTALEFLALTRGAT